MKNSRRAITLWPILSGEVGAGGGNLVGESVNWEARWSEVASNPDSIFFFSLIYFGRGGVVVVVVFVVVV